MKKFTAILLTVLMIASLFISCENKITPVSDETVSVSFDESTSRSLTASLDPFKANDYYWAYKAVKRDNTGLISGQTNFAWIDNVNKGLTKKVAGFSQGVWEFTLYAYTEEDNVSSKKINIKTVLKVVLITIPIIVAVQIGLSYLLENLGLNYDIVDKINIYSNTSVISSILFFIYIAVLPAIFEELYVRKSVLKFSQKYGIMHTS